MTVGDVCTRSVVTSLASDTIADAARRMRDGHVGALVVVDNLDKPRPIGMLTDRDIVIGAVAQCPDRLEALRVGDVMTREPITTRPAETIHDALARMRARGIRRLPVVAPDGTLDGLLAFDDALEVVSDELRALVGLVTREQKRERERRT